MIQTHERSLNQISAALYNGFVQPKSLSAIFLDSWKSSCISYKMTKDSHRILSSPRIPEDDLPGPVSHLPGTEKSRKVTLVGQSHLRNH